VETGIEELRSTTDIIASAGHLPGSRDYSLDRMPADHEVTAALLLDAGSPVYRLRRVRLADDHPVIYCHDYLPVSLIPEDLIRRYAGSGSLFAFLRAECGLSIAVARTVLKPVLPAEDIARALGVSRSEPLLLLRQTHFDPQNRPFLHSTNYINSSLFEFHVRRMPPSFFTSHPASQLSSPGDGPAS
jgi:GntR family transcriptional regulator